MSRDARLFTVEVETATGPARGRMAVQTGPMRLAELVPLACELAELQVTRASEAEERAGRPVSCRAGCGACCRQMVPLSPPEVFYLGEVVGRSDPALRERWRRGFDRIIEAATESGLRARLTRPDLSVDEGMAIALEWFRMGVPCPFLENESCGIHPVRPAVCREYNVTSPAEWCADPVAHEIVRVPVPRSVSEALSRLTRELTGTELRLVPLGLAPIWAASHSELDRRTWDGPELFARFIDLLGGRAPGPADSGPAEGG
ncbi:MAG: YkgJ family cysteine cluster protein [Myxococcota bacterium]